MHRIPPPRSHTHLPYTTLFRSRVNECTFFRYLLCNTRYTTVDHIKKARNQEKNTPQDSSKIPRRPVKIKEGIDRKSTRLNSSHLVTSYADFCSKQKHRHVGRGQ